MHFRILTKAIFQNTSKRLLLIVSWAFIARTELLFYSITQKTTTYLRINERFILIRFITLIFCSSNFQVKGCHQVFMLSVMFHSDRNSLDYLVKLSTHYGIIYGIQRQMQDPIRSKMEVCVNHVHGVCWPEHCLIQKSSRLTKV